MFTHPQLRKVICNSKMVRDDIARRFGLSDDKLTVIYNGVDTDQFNPEVRSFRSVKCWAFPTMPVLAYVGSGFSRKGVATALRAIVAHPDVGCLLPGAINMRGSSKTGASAGGLLTSDVPGPVANVREVYGTADALILPTLYDPSQTSAWKRWPAVCRCSPATVVARRSG